MSSFLLQVLIILSGGHFIGNRHMAFDIVIYSISTNALDVYSFFYAYTTVFQPIRPKRSLFCNIYGKISG